MTPRGSFILGLMGIVVPVAVVFFLGMIAGSGTGWPL